MKKIYLKTLLFSVMACFTACDSLLDLNPEDAISKETFFQDQNDFQLAINGLYSGLRPLGEDALDGSYAGNLFWEVCGDAIYYKNSWTLPWYDISCGKLNPNTSGIQSVWGNLYNTINWANTILEALERNGSKLDEKVRKEVLGQAHFVRAICYIRLCSLWGAVPLVDRILTPAESKLPRTSADEINTKLIIPDLTIAVNNLEETPYSGLKGRATKLSAMGMKVRAYLYNKNYRETVDAALELMEIAKTSKNVMFLEDYDRIFSNDNEDNPEILFCLKYTAGGSQQGSTFNTPFGGKVPGLAEGSMNGSWATTALSPDYIDSYPMIDGLPSDRSSKYDPEHPWKNRGARFESTFYIAGQSEVNGIMFDNTMVATISAKMAEDYPFNLDKGYMNEDSKVEWLKEDESDFIILRYTDVLMMYAEAKAELNEIDQSVYDILDAVRKRAGIAVVARGQSQTEMIETIRQERKWEFAFEGLRYFDIRRWGIAEKVFKDITAHKRYDLGSTKTFVAPNHYLWPLPQSAVDVNPNLLPDNTGY